MRRVRYQVLGLGLVFCVGLSGCTEGVNPTDNGNRAANRGGQVTERDVQDPTVFSKRENGLWDGRPSLGGVWVAHPDATTPERVIIRNTETGRDTVGALFRRERMNPGPAFQISGEAANVLGVLPGAPTMIEVVALRTEEVVVPGPGDAPAMARDDADSDAQPTGQDTAGTPQPPETVMSQTAEAEPQQARRGGFLTRLFGGGDTAAQPVATAGTIASTPIDAPPEAAETALPAAPQQAAPAAAVSALDRPFIQLGIFSVEENARNAERMAGSADLSARVVEGSAQGNAFWRVVVGPAQTDAAQRQMLARVKSLGFNDAYAVRR